jgi:transcription-repair coupling factor (superfamily II helicase)
VVTAEPADAQRLADELPFFAPGLRVAVFPDWETLPWDTFSPHQDLISERLATLWKVLQRELDVVLLPATTALTRLAPPSFLAGTTFHFKHKSRLDEARLKGQLTLAGYSHVTQVVSPGEYAVRGGLIDLFPMGSLVPLRVDLFDNEIDSIRTFDPDSQRSLYPVPSVRLLPGREFPMDESARARFRSRWRELLEGDPTRSRIYKDIGNGVATAGIEYYLPLFFDETASVFDYLGAARPILASAPVGELTRLVDTARCGWNVPPEDPVAMADAIRRAAADPVDSRARGEAGREYALEHYDRAALAQRFVSLVDDLVAGSR